MADFDVIVVGAGCAGSAAACVLAREGKGVLLVERGTDAGSKNMTGGRIYTHALRDVIPDFEDDAPLERRITCERISLMTEDAATTVEYASPALGAPENASYAVLRGPFDSWLASKAEQAGAECVFGITVDGLVKDGARIAGIRANGDEITADITILADGANSLLVEEAGLGKRPLPHQMAVSAKETIALPPETIDDRFRAAPGEGTAWLFAGSPTGGHVGGGFLYTNRDSVSIGLVATLSDLCTSTVALPDLLERFKQHPAVEPVLRGGKLVEYSGHMVPEGGLAMVPELTGDGCLVAGDAAMLCVNLGYQVRGMDYALASGRMAAEAALEALEAGDTSAAGLQGYRSRLEQSFVLQDMRAYRDFPAFMEKTTRIFDTYPAMASDMMQSLFKVAGAPVRPLRKKMMEPLRRVGLMTVLGDVRKGMKAL